MPRFNFDGWKEEVSTGKKELFPSNLTGGILLQRKELVNKLCDMLLDPGEFGGVSWNHYFRSPAGNGKSVLLMLLGREFEKRNCDVFYFEVAGLLDDYPKESYIEARRESLRQNKKLVIMVDEVQQSPDANLWTPLLKSMGNMLVIGMGIPKFDSSSPQFLRKHSPSELYFNSNSEDMEELIDVFMEEMKGRDVSRETVSEICRYVCDYTGGHMFPMLKFCEHIFHPNQSSHLEKYHYAIYFSSQKFYDSYDYDNVRGRCFSQLPLGPISEVLRCGRKVNTDMVSLDKCGYWNYKKGWFISKCLVDVIYNTLPNDSECHKESISIHDLNVSEKIERIINIGLHHMAPSDFEEPTSDMSKYEDAIGFGWAWQVKCCFPSLYIATQVQQPTGVKIKKGGKHPCIDFVFNGENDIGIELVRNGRNKECAEHVARFDGKYKRWGESGAVLNFITDDTKVKDLFESPKVPVYHFFKGENALYKGNTLLKQGVVRSLPTPPPKRGFCTMRNLGSKILTNSLKYIR